MILADRFNPLNLIIIHTPVIALSAQFSYFLAKQLSPNSLSSLKNPDCNAYNGELMMRLTLKIDVFDVLYKLRSYRLPP